MNEDNKIEPMFLKLYEEYADAIFRHCYFRINNREEATDLTQEVFMKVWRYMANGEKIDNHRALFYKMANNSVIDYYRRKKPVSLDSLNEAGFDMASNDHQKINNLVEAKQVAQFLNKLEPDYKQALTMRYIDDLSVQEIADILGERENTVSVRIHRGLEKIKNLIEHEI